MGGGGAVPSLDGDCLTLGLRYAAELRGDPDRWLAR